MGIIRRFNGALIFIICPLWAFLNCYPAYSADPPNFPMNPESQCQQLVEQGKLEEAIGIAERGISQAPTDIQAAKLWMCKGAAFDRLGKLDQSMQSYDQALKLAKTNNALSLSVLVLLKKADLFVLGNRFEQSQKVLTEAWQIVQALGDQALQENVLNSLAIVYYETQKYDQAERYYLELLSLKGEKIAQDDLATTLFNLGHVYGAKKEFVKADKVFAKSLQISEDINSSEGVAYTLKAWGVNLHAQGRLQESQEKLSLALALFTKSGDLRQKASTLRNLADVEMEKQQFSEAIDHYLQALPILEEQGFNNALMRTYRGLAIAYEKVSSFQLAYENYKNYTSLLHQQMEEKSQQVTQELQVAFETQRYQADNHRLASENRDQEIKLLYREQILQMQKVAIGLVLVIIALIIFMWRRSFKQAQRMEKLATTDELTKLHNRRSIMSFGEMELNRFKRFNRNFSLLLLDIDFFKKVNDAYGHAVGDEVLQVVATAVSNIIRTTDRIGRYGGEEFMIIAPETNTDQALQLAERVRLSVETALCTSVPDLTVTVSIGIAGYIFEPKASEPNGLELGTLIAQADKALYEAKSNGRNQARLYTG